VAGIYDGILVDGLEGELDCPPTGQPGVAWWV
jgi:hypothetical protein